MGCDTENVSSAEDWLQGDVVKRIGDDPAPPFFVIISADCDIAQGKTGPDGYACLGAWPLADYLVNDHSPAVALKELSRSITSITNNINAYRERNDPLSRPMTPTAVERWFQVASDEEIREALRLSPATPRNLMTEITRVVAAARAMAAQQENWAVSVIKILKNHDTAAAAMNAILREVAPRKLSIDMFFFSELPLEDHLGYIVKLRALRFIESRQLFRSPSEARCEDHAYLRVGRLTPTYRHGLAQQFGNLYSRIGYHEHYEDDRDARFVLCKEHLTNRIT